MLYFILGIVVGLSMASLFVLVELYFGGNFLEKKARKLGKELKITPKGYVLALDEVAERRENIIRNNEEKGLDTPLTDIYDT